MRDFPACSSPVIEPTSREFLKLDLGKTTSKSATVEFIGGYGTCDGNARNGLIRKRKTKIRLGFNDEKRDADGEKKWTDSSDFVKVRLMLREGRPVEEPAGPATPAPKRGIKSESFQRWFRGSKVSRADGAPLPVYHASPATADLRPKSYGTAGEHGYFYFAVSKAWARNCAREESGGRQFIRRFYLALKKVKSKYAALIPACAVA